MIFIKCLSGFSLYCFINLFLSSFCVYLQLLFSAGAEELLITSAVSTIKKSQVSSAKFPFFLFVIRENSRITKRKLKKFSYCANNNRVWFVSIITTTVHIDMTCVIPDIRYDYVYRRKTGGRDIWWWPGNVFVSSVLFSSFFFRKMTFSSTLSFYFFFLVFVWRGGGYYYEHRER